VATGSQTVTVLKHDKFYSTQFLLRSLFIYLFGKQTIMKLPICKIFWYDNDEDDYKN
jgi:hypothetical protein